MAISKEAKELFRSSRDLKAVQMEVAKSKILDTIDPQIQELIEEELRKELETENEITDDLEEEIDLDNDTESEEIVEPIPTNDEIDGVDEDLGEIPNDELGEDAETISVEIDGDVYEGDYAKGDEVVELELVDDVENGLGEEGSELDLDLENEDDELEIDLEEDDSLEIDLDDEEEGEEEEEDLLEVRKVIRDIIREELNSKEAVEETEEIEDTEDDDEEETISEAKTSDREILIESLNKKETIKASKKTNTLEERLVKRGLLPKKVNKKALNESESKKVYDRLTELLNF